MKKAENPPFAQLKKSIRHLLLLMLIIGLSISSPVRNGLADLLEVKPLSIHTLHILREHKPLFSYYAARYDIPLAATAAAVGSEVNRRIYINQVVDYLQDLFFASRLCSDRLLTISSHLGVENRYINISKQDIGMGNIKFETAWNIYLKYPDEMAHVSTRKDLVNYLLTDNGNIHIASLVIKEAKSRFGQYCQEMDEVSRNAVYYSYYKQGESYYDRYCKRSSFGRPPIAGSGHDILRLLDQAL